MIFFYPESEGKEKDAINCVKMAIDMQNTMKTLSKIFMKNFNLPHPLNHEDWY